MRAFLPFLFFILFVGVSPTKIHTPPTKTKLKERASDRVEKQTQVLSQAIDAEKNRDITSAISLFRQALQVATSRDDKARAYIGLLRAQNALGQAKFYIEKNDSASLALFEENIKLSEEFLKGHPDKVEAWFAHVVTSGNLALLSSPRRKVQLAQNIEANLRKAEAIDPKFPYTYLARGVFFIEAAGVSSFVRFIASLLWGEVPKASLQDAEMQLRKSLELDPHFLFTRYALSNCLKKQGRKEEAIREIREILSRPMIDYNDDIWKKLATESLNQLNAR